MPEATEPEHEDQRQRQEGKQERSRVEEHSASMRPRADPLGGASPGAMTLNVSEKLDCFCPHVPRRWQVTDDFGAQRPRAVGEGSEG